LIGASVWLICTDCALRSLDLRKLPGAATAARAGASSCAGSRAGFCGEVQLDVDGVVGPQQVGEFGADPLPNLGSVGPRIMIETDGEHICGGL
jgi:hypothetical protein